MFAFSARLEMDHPASVVWPYLLAFEQVPLWEHGVVEVRQLTPGVANIGTEISARRIYAGRETGLSGRIVAYAEGRSATISLRGGPHDEALVEYAVEPIDGHRCGVTYTGRGTLVWPLRFLHPILPAIGRSEAKQNLLSLKRRIDAGIPPRSSERPPRARG